MNRLLVSLVTWALPVSTVTQGLSNHIRPFAVVQLGEQPNSRFPEGRQPSSLNLPFGLESTRPNQPITKIVPCKVHWPTREISLDHEKCNEKVTTLDVSCVVKGRPSIIKFWVVALPLWGCSGGRSGTSTCCTCTFCYG